MSKLSEIINQPEGRKLEFKEALPVNADLAKTIIAFQTMLVAKCILGLKIIRVRL